MMNQLYLYVAMVGVLFVLLALTRSAGKRKQAPQAVVAPDMPPSNAFVDQELRETLEEFMNELEKDNTKLIDTVTRLQTDYKQELSAQQALTQSLQQQVHDLSAEVEGLKAELQDARTALSDVAGNLAAQAAQDVQTAQDAVSQQPTAEELAALEAPVPRKPAFAFNEKYARVVELSRQGMAAEQIARETDIGLGEIQFVIGLSKREEG